MAVAEPESEDEVLRAVVPVCSRNPVPEIAAVPGSADAEPLAGVAACNLTLGVARVAEPQDVAPVAGRRNSGSEAASTSADVPAPGAARAANKLATAAADPTSGSSADAIAKADDIPYRNAKGPHGSSAPVAVREEQHPNAVRAEFRTDEFLCAMEETTGRDYGVAQDQAPPSTTAHQ
jgi:hypothetical protein